MESRLYIPAPPRDYDDGWTKETEARGPLDVRGEMRPAYRQIRRHKARSQLRGIFGGTDSVASGFQETHSSRPKVTVPKPTQVGRKNILRRARELLLRNSANYSRNFGRREALCGD
jgi:hypothetical protein